MFVILSEEVLDSSYTKHAAQFLSNAREHYYQRDEMVSTTSM
jgi:hypothetical protein